MTVANRITQMKIPLCLLGTLYLTICQLVCQQRSYIGINVPSLLVSTLDVRTEHSLNERFALQGAFAVRTQGKEPNETPQIAPLKDYIQIKNRAMSLSLGARIFDRQFSEYPYIALDISGVYYNETIIPRNKSKAIDVSDVKWGGTLTIGMVTELFERVHLDLGLQFGYSKPRNDLLAYYLPGLGYTSFGFGRYGIEGGHFQPVANIKYNLTKDRRRRIRQMR